MTIHKAKARRFHASLCVPAWENDADAHESIEKQKRKINYAGSKKPLLTESRRRTHLGDVYRKNSSIAEKTNVI
jgi:hypothetical protein